MSNYPPGMTASDYDHVEGPLAEEEIDDPCPRCLELGPVHHLLRLTWRAAPTVLVCDFCDYSAPDDDEPRG